MAANLAPILLFLPCPGSGALFAAKMVRLASLRPAAPEVPILEVHFPNDSPADLIGQTRVPTSFIVLLKDLRAGVLNQASQYQIYNLTRPDEGIQRGVGDRVDMRTTGSPATTKICTVFPDCIVIHREPAAAAWLTLAPVIAIAVEAYNELVHGV
ncbi:hypothetical protein B0H10DRAFT_2184128 [Mycena sp. CBHHK59/15]|nr:hypothetical protein B0H10DRAFT_2184128 [Mycena sp. CBHHK59/15]